MASTTRTAADLANHGTTLAAEMGTRTDVLRSIDEMTTIVVMSVLTPVLLLKVFIKRYFGGSCDREDQALAFAAIAMLAYCIIALLMSHYGGGNHEWEVPTPDLMMFQKLLYANTIVYGPAAFLTKTALLLIFTRVFAHARRAVIFIYVLIGVMACYYVPIFILKIRICTPIEGLWNPSVDVVCFNQQSIFFTDAIVSVVTGAVVLLLPIPLVYTLKVNWCKRLRIAALLGVGGLSTVASIWRAVLVWSPNAYEDITVTFVRINLLGIAEVSIGIFSACLPTFNLLLTRYAKVRRTPSPKDVVTGNPIPECNIKRLSAMDLWKAGHKYGMSLGNEVDCAGGDCGVSDGKLRDVEELRELKTHVSCEAEIIHWDSRSEGDRYGDGEEENQAVTPVMDRKLPELPAPAVEIEIEDLPEIERVLERQRRRLRRETTVPDWPLPLRTKSMASRTVSGDGV